MSKYIVILVGLVLSGGLGYYLGTGNVQIQEQEKIVYREVAGETKIVERIVTVTKIVRPDGTTEETTRTEDRDQHESRRESETDIARNKTTEPVSAQYSLGVRFHQSYSEILNITNEYRDPRNYDAILGRRILGPVWLEAGISLNQYSVGVRWEF